MKSLRFRASFAFASSLAVLLATISPAQADELWTPPIPKPGSGAVNIFEGGTGIGVSIISANKESGANSGAFLCEVVGQGKCAPGSGYGVVGELLLPKCQADESNCIESVSVFAKGTKPVPATFVEQLPGPTTPAYPDALIPQGSTKSLWNAEGVNHTGGNSTYMAYARLAFRVSNGKAVFTSIGAGVSPVVNKRSPMFSDLEVVEKKFGSRNTVGVNGIVANCEYVYQGNCGRAQNFAADSRISIKIRVSNKVTGWLSGRLAAPEIDIQTLSDTDNVITVTAEPVAVATVQAVMTKSNATPALRQTSIFRGTWNAIDSGRAQSVGIPANSASSIPTLELLRKIANDTADDVNRIWNFASIERPSPKLNSCMKSKTRLLGIVTTNATVYEGGTPTFSGGNLSYQVAGMHYLPGGKSLSRGTYDLVMRSDVARCLYGFTSAPIRASVSVINEKGSKSAATTLISESDGWLKLSANNFTFSKKTIKIKLTGTKDTAKK